MEYFFSGRMLPDEPMPAILPGIPSPPSSQSMRFVNELDQFWHVLVFYSCQKTFEGTDFPGSSHMLKGSAELSGHFSKKPVSLPSCFYWAGCHLSVLFPGSELGSCAKPEFADRAGSLFFTTLISQPVWCAYRILTLQMHQGKGYSSVPLLWR